MKISLTAEQKTALAALGVVADERGFLTAGGRPVSDGAAAVLLKDATGTGEVSKGLVPASYHRPYLSAGHQSDSPANTGMRATVPVPESHPAEPQDFHRSWIRPGHEAPSPGDGAPNNPNMPGASAAAVYAAGERAYQQNQQMARTEHVMPSAALVSAPAPSRMAVPADMRASAVPVHVAMQATRPSPGEADR